jgi:hypothetical protein
VFTIAGSVIIAAALPSNKYQNWRDVGSC